MAEKSVNQEPNSENKEQETRDLRQIKEDLQELHKEEDGRNKEWQDRSRVNLEKVPDNITTNIERDFEPEQVPEKGNADPDPAY